MSTRNGEVMARVRLFLDLDLPGSAAMLIQMGIGFFKIMEHLPPRGPMRLAVFLPDGAPNQRAPLFRRAGLDPGAPPGPKRRVPPSSLSIQPDSTGDRGNKGKGRRQLGHISIDISDVRRGAAIRLRPKPMVLTLRRRRIALQAGVNLHFASRLKILDVKWVKVWVVQP
jgi:hypothetical protein